MRHLLTLTLLAIFARIDVVIATSAADFANQKITIALRQEPPQLNSMVATDQVSTFVLPHVMEGLVRYDRRGRIVPGVAERWEFTATEVTFWLRENALWSDGQPVTAHDFVFAWRSALKPETASEYAFILYPLKNAERINKGELTPETLKVWALDDYTLKLELERPISYFLKLAAFTTYFPVRKDFFLARGEKYAAEASDLLYNGPFKIVNWVHSASLKMIKNESYWGKEKIILNGIHAAYITEDTRARLNLFIDGKIVHTRLDDKTYKDALVQRLRIRSFATGSIYFLEYNHRPGRLTTNVNLRKAIQHIFDADEFVNRVVATPGNLPGKSLFPVWLQGVEGTFRQEYPAPEVTPSDVKAKAYLTAARQELRQQLQVAEIPPLVLLVGNNPLDGKQAEYLQGLFKTKLDLELKIDIQTFKQRLAKMTAGEFDMVNAGWGADFNDIMTFGDLFASWNLNNRGRYHNTEYDRQVRIAMNSLNAKIRMDAMAELQRILHDEAVMLPQYEQGVIYLMHNKLRGVVRRVVGADPDYTYASVIE